MTRKIILGIGIAGAIGAAVFFATKDGASANESNSSQPHVTVEEGTIIEKALAVGTIEPQNEIQVKSKISGVVSRIYTEPGTYIERGQPLIKIEPDPTPLELAEAKRNLEMTAIEVNTARRELDRMTQLKDRNLISEREFEEFIRRHDDAVLRDQMNRERLQLLESGSVTIAGTEIESIIKAPISGFILEKMVDIGDPVVPLTSFQAGTPLMTMAAMDNLLFKGTVDEIDVGKLYEGMPAEIKIGAMPGVVITGHLDKISLKAQRQENAIVFPVEIVIDNTNGHTLRAGFSANADIIIERRENILIVPERVINFTDGISMVEIQGSSPDSRVEHQIETGLSDAINIEVKDGLKKGDKVLEKPVRKLTVD
ncbi:MAG: efflux RND transporter periplasmic adaptor subunit [Rhodothermaceae bacterium]|nr:efflux RND transporter periplasmic adaptor subunit [Rhodothermaceae bacterium]